MPRRARTRSLANRLLRLRADTRSQRHIDDLQASGTELRTSELVLFLTDPTPGVRRAAARALGWSERGAPELLRALASERTDTVATALAAAALRAGADSSETVGLLDRHRARAFETERGPRSPARIPGTDLGRLPSALWWELGRLDEGRPLGRAEALSRWFTSAEVARDALPAVACQGGPQVDEFLRHLGRSSGRRLGHAWVDALGWAGSPHWERPLRKALRSIDRDPSHGLATRRAAAGSLGRLGLPSAGPTLVGALQAEAADHEGRPGAGLGIQFPTRAAIVWALGEAGVTDAAPLLVNLLTEDSAAPTGGLHLAAADALWKLGAAAVPLVSDQRSSAQRSVALLAQSILGEPRP